MRDISETGIGGVKEAVASVTGNGVFGRLKFESGVHRVQRVPETEASGRIHTSAATVAVLPQPEGDVDIVIDDKDIRIDTMRASGAGGQHVNKTDSAVRITHMPSGIVVISQLKSQHQNRAKPCRCCAPSFMTPSASAKPSERAAERKGQIGSGDRSERIRTYNFPQGRVTDHRINLTRLQSARGHRRRARSDPGCAGGRRSGARSSRRLRRRRERDAGLRCGRESRKRLEAAGVETPVLDARLLLEAGAGVSRARNRHRSAPVAHR